MRAQSGNVFFKKSSWSQLVEREARARIIRSVDIRLLSLTHTLLQKPESAVTVLSFLACLVPSLYHHFERVMTKIKHHLKQESEMEYYCLPSALNSSEHFKVPTTHNAYQRDTSNKIEKQKFVLCILKWGFPTAFISVLDISIFYS